MNDLNGKRNCETNVSSNYTHHTELTFRCTGPVSIGEGNRVGFGTLAHLNVRFYICARSSSTGGLFEYKQVAIINTHATHSVAPPRKYSATTKEILSPLTKFFMLKLSVDVISISQEFRRCTHKLKAGTVADSM